MSPTRIYINTKFKFHQQWEHKCEKGLKYKGKYKFVSSFLYGATGNISSADTIDFFPGTLDDCDPANKGLLSAYCEYNIVNTTDSSQKITAYVDTHDMYRGAVILDDDGEDTGNLDTSAEKRANILTKGVIRHSIDSNNPYPLDVLNNAADFESYLGNTTGFRVYDKGFNEYDDDDNRDGSPYCIKADEIQDTIDIAEKDGDFDGYDPFFYRIGDIESAEIDPIALKTGTYKADVTFTFGLNLESNYRAAHI